MARNWIKGAIKHPGSFRKAAEKAGKSTAAFATEHEHDSGTLGKRARLAKTLMGMHADGGEVAPGHAKGGEVKSVASKPKHQFRKGHTMPPRRPPPAAPMPEDAAANPAGDGQEGPPMPMQGGVPPPGAPTVGGPAPGGIPGQSTGGSVSKTAPMSRMSKMYSPKKVMRN